MSITSRRIQARVERPPTSAFGIRIHHHHRRRRRHPPVSSQLPNESNETSAASEKGREERRRKALEDTAVELSSRLDGSWWRGRGTGYPMTEMLFLLVARNHITLKSDTLAVSTTSPKRTTTPHEPPPLNLGFLLRVLEPRAGRERDALAHGRLLVRRRC
ncbi:hypothetical protein FIBSPDRAFT_963656 [Athelia psychrophila]|uniref:Uncharacterized protein n=1 Tax=Athelia psychrophila TaxID=1759441 RepID=A0A165YQ17_9AGAM|nr:hypothetical protein FIBSPDRAFT_963656 [Fibularhizoctonia sp. CBS 109695]